MDQNLNLLTVDLEEWFVVDILSERCPPEQWDKLPSTLITNTRRLLQLFRRHDVSATWFVLGWSARKYPQLIREIVDQGHEIACHSFLHRRVDRMDPESFRRDTHLAVEAISRAVGFVPIGYRAPSWSINATIPWAFEILTEFGFEYDSSIFPIKHDLYGIPGGPRQMFRMRLKNGSTLWEIPASTCRLLGHNIPVAGGGFLRHAPYWYSRRMVSALNSHNQPAIVYMHPWEIDPVPPKVEGLTFFQRYRNYGATSMMYRKLDRLLSDFVFTTISDYIRQARRRRIGFQ